MANHSLDDDDDASYPMMCGNCGCRTFRMRRRRGKLVAKCTKCPATTVIAVEARVTLDFGKGSPGCLCPAGR